MAISLRSTILAQIGWTWNDQENDVTMTDSNKLVSSQELSSGTGTNQADCVWHEESQVLAIGESTTWELDALTKSFFGDTITIQLLTIKAILILNKTATSGGTLVVGGASSNQWYSAFNAADNKVKIEAGGLLLMSNPGDGWAVSAGSTDLKIESTGGNVTYDVAIIGTMNAAGGSSGA